MFQVEQCLDTYEKTYNGVIDFIGEEPNEMSAYGATNDLNIVEQRDLIRQ
jgi:hypothetical protein